MVWVFIVVLCTLVLGFLVEPFFRKSKSPNNLDEQDYLAAQIDDIARDREAGLISAEEADFASNDARRRLLAAARAGTKEITKGANSGFRQISTMVISAAPIAAVAIYLALGNPGKETTDEATLIASRSQNPPSTQNAKPLAESITALEEKVAASPDNLDDWILLAESYAGMDRFDAAARAFGKARELAPERAFLHAAEGEAIAMAAGGNVTPVADEAFDRALEIDPVEPRARFYKALSAYQQGDPDDALNRLVTLANEAPPSAPWLTVVRSQIEIIAGELGKPLDGLGLRVPTLSTAQSETPSEDAPFEDWVAAIEAQAKKGDIAGAKRVLESARGRYAQAPFVMQQLAQIEAQLEQPDTPRGPSVEEMKAAQNLSPEDRNAMIEGMVEGLAARLETEPDDIEGWTMLARSYSVLGEFQKSANAYSQAIELAPDEFPLHLGRAEALLTVLRSEGKPIDIETKAAIDSVSKLNPEHPFALYFQGLAASQTGDAARARSYWERLLASMPEGTPEAESVRQMIDEL
ncbi:c-type cytochrome biogenesis protein CcmI [Hyphococcus lacteus]|uniref:C-type cytochrome biogenesis protein CcmI n=1 Tax=Hyphococcus lacteus TaxID=3143536 RepID=A0ABV3Z8B4_9PROT